MSKVKDGKRKLRVLTVFLISKAICLDVIGRLKPPRFSVGEAIFRCNQNMAPTYCIAPFGSSPLRALVRLCASAMGMTREADLS